MTKTFERFLRSFSDADLVAFAQDRSRLQPPYWKALRLALAIEATRRGLRLDDNEIVSRAEPSSARGSHVETA